MKDIKNFLAKELFEFYAKGHYDIDVFISYISLEFNFSREFIKTMVYDEVQKYFLKGYIGRSKNLKDFYEQEQKKQKGE